MSVAELLSRRDLGARILRKVLVSLVLGGLAYLLTEVTGQPDIWSLTMSVFVGGVTLVVQFLMEFENRLGKVEESKARHSARIERMVADGFARISEATELFSRVEASAVRTDAVTQLVRHATMIQTGGPTLIPSLALTEIKRVSELLKGLSEGVGVTYEGEDRDWLLALTRLAESTIDAISLTTVDGRGHGFTDGGFWSSDLGQRYLETQQDAVRRGVKIRRIFTILHTTTDPTTFAGLTEVCRLQQQVGVEARVLGREDIPGTVRDAMYDFVLFDENVSYETAAASQIEDTARPTILNTRLELRPERVTGRMQRFKLLWDSAEPFD
jgi:hypothetical protein